MNRNLLSTDMVTGSQRTRTYLCDTNRHDSNSCGVTAQWFVQKAVIIDPPVDPPLSFWQKLKHAFTDE